MKIVLFIDCLRNGGAQRQMSEMSKLFVKYGHDVSLVSFVNAPDDYEYPKQVKRIRLHGNGKLGRFISIYNFVKNVDCDAIVGFIAVELLVFASVLSLSRKNYKLIIGERSLTLGKPSFEEWFRFNCIFRFVDFIVPNSYSQTEFLKKLKPKMKDKIITISNYLDIDKYCYNAPPENDIPVIGVFARYAAVKNGLRLAEAVNQVVKKGCRPFLIQWYGHKTDAAGQLTDDYTELSSYITNSKLNDYFILNDRVKNVNSVMTTMDAVCLASIYEGFSNSIAEGISCGKPMLVGNVSDNVVMVHDGVNGFVFEPTDVDSISSALESFLALSGKEICDMGKNSRRIAETIFNEELFVSSYLKLMS